MSSADDGEREASWLAFEHGHELDEVELSDAERALAPPALCARVAAARLFPLPPRTAAAHLHIAADDAGRLRPLPPATPLARARTRAFRLQCAAPDAAGGAAALVLTWHFDAAAGAWRCGATLLDSALADAAAGEPDADQWRADGAAVLAAVRTAAVAQQWLVRLRALWRARGRDARGVPRVRARAAQRRADGQWRTVAADDDDDDDDDDEQAAASDDAVPAAAVAHFVYEQSGAQQCVLLPAGGGDAVVHSAVAADRDVLGAANDGQRGVDAFAARHQCGAACAALGLRAIAEARQLAKAGSLPQVAAISAEGASGAASAGVPPISPITPRTRERRSFFVRSAKKKLAQSGERKSAHSAKTYELDHNAIPDFGLLCALEGHKRSVSALLPLADSHLLSASDDKTVCVWKLDGFEVTHTLDGHAQEVTCLWATDDFILTGSADNTVRVYARQAPHKLVATLRAGDSVYGVVVAANRIFAAAGKSLSWWEIDASGGEFEKSRKTLDGHTKSVKALTAASDYVFSGSNDKTIRVWDARTAEHKYTMSDHDGWIRKLLVHDRRLYSCSYDSTCKIFEIATLTCVRTIKLPTRPESCCVWNEFLFVGTDDARMFAYHAAGPHDEKPVAIIKEHKLAVLSLAANDDLVFSGGYDSKVNVYGEQAPDEDIDEGEEGGK